MKNLFRRLFDKPLATPVQAPPEEEVVPPIPSEAPAETKKPRAAAGHPGIGDTAQKLEAARCHLHPLYPLLPVTVEVLLPSSTQPLKMKVLRCTKARCDQHYTSEFGYFRFVAGPPSEMGEIKTTPHCQTDHESRSMMVTKLGGEFLWACPEEACVNTIPYVEVVEQ